MKLAPAIVSLAALVAAAPAAVAADPVKIGLVAEFSGPFAAYGKQIENGMKAYLKAHGDTVAGRKIEILERDTTGPAPEVAKRVAQDLVTNDKIDFLAGFGLSPNAFAVAAVATQAKTPMVIMNAASSMITTKSPYVVRFSMTLPQVTEPMALWAAKNGIKKVYSIVSDYAPGIDAEGAFEKAFTSHGGTIAGSVRVPLKNPDFAPFVQRAKDAKPEAVFIFVPAGEQSVAFVKAFAERGLREAGIKIIGPGDVVDDDVLESMG
ncbi:MAG TPA: ABC transporter substrate-binding protein, partial [Myxococcales bacterium]|nr:ABC transporter substrate-binding protein [Myxococcales bacterium]